MAPTPNRAQSILERTRAARARISDPVIRCAAPLSVMWLRNSADMPEGVPELTKFNVRVSLVCDPPHTRLLATTRRAR